MNGSGSGSNLPASRHQNHRGTQASQYTEQQHEHHTQAQYHRHHHPHQYHTSEQDSLQRPDASSFAQQYEHHHTHHHQQQQQYSSSTQSTRHRERERTASGSASLNATPIPQRVARSNHQGPSEHLRQGQGTSSSEAPVRIRALSLDNVLTSSANDPHQALSNVLVRYNDLVSDAESSRSERTRLVEENSRLWSRSSELKQERDSLQRELNTTTSSSLSRENRILATRVAELEQLLAMHGIPVPPPSKDRLSPIMNIPTRFSSDSAISSNAPNVEARRPSPGPRSISDTNAVQRERQRSLRNEAERHGMLSNSTSTNSFATATSSSSADYASSRGTDTSGRERSRLGGARTPPTQHHPQHYSLSASTSASSSLSSSSPFLAQQGQFAGRLGGSNTRDRDHNANAVPTSSLSTPPLSSSASAAALAPYDSSLTPGQAYLQPRETAGLAAIPSTPVLYGKDLDEGPQLSQSPVQQSFPQSATPSSRIRSNTSAASTSSHDQHLQIAKSTSLPHSPAISNSSFSHSSHAPSNHSPRSPYTRTTSSPQVGAPASPRAQQFWSANTNMAGIGSAPPLLAKAPSASSTGTAGGRGLTRKASSLDLGRNIEKSPVPSRSATPPPDLGSPSLHTSPVSNSNSPPRTPFNASSGFDGRSSQDHTTAGSQWATPMAGMPDEARKYIIAQNGGISLPSPVSPFVAASGGAVETEDEGARGVQMGGLGITHTSTAGPPDQSSDKQRHHVRAPAGSDPRLRRASSAIRAITQSHEHSGNSSPSFSQTTFVHHSQQPPLPQPSSSNPPLALNTRQQYKTSISASGRDVPDGALEPLASPTTTQHPPTSPLRSTRPNLTDRPTAMYNTSSSTSTAPQYASVHDDTRSQPYRAGAPSAEAGQQPSHRQQILQDPPVPRRPSQSSQTVPMLFPHPQRSRDAYGEPKAGAAPSYGLLGPSSTSSTGMRCLPLVPGLLPLVNVEVVNSSIKIADRGREVVSFLIRVAAQSPPHDDPRQALMVAGVPRTWIIEKTWNDLQNVDALIKSKNAKANVKRIPGLPDKSLFKDHAPSKVDQRKTDLQRFLQGVCQSRLHELGDFCSFLTTSIVSDRAAPVSNPGYKAGYLTKKGRNFGGWTTRYYVLQGRMLEYYDTPGGQHLGSIDIKDANIGRQNNSRTTAGADDSIRHAFLIRAKDKSGEDTDHILCAESDEERDHWVSMLVCCLTGEYIPDTIASIPAASANASRPPQPPPHDRLRNPIKKGSKDVEITKTSAQPISQLPQGQQNPKLFGGPTYSEDSRRPAHPQHEAVAGNHRREHSAGQSSTNSAAEDSNLPHNRLHRALRGHHGSQHGSDLTSSTSVPANLDQVAPQDSQSSFNASASGAASNGTSQNHAPPSHRFGNVVNQGDMDAFNAAARPKSPEKKVKISCPSNGAPIGADFKQQQRNLDKRAKYKSSFWNFAGRGGPERRDANAAPPRPVFGVTLQEAVEIARVREDSDLPAVVFRCVQYLSSVRAENEEGIYRMNGSSAVIKNLKDRFNAEGDVDLTSEYFDPHAIAGLLKSFFRELPVHIFTNELNPDFIRANDIEDHSRKVKELCRLVQSLPVANYSALRFLSAHLVKIVQKESINKMSVRNMGIVFSPTLAIPATLFALFLNEFDRIFREVDDDEPGENDNEAGVDGQAASATGGASPRPSSWQSIGRRRSRNSTLFTQSGADKLLEVVNDLEAATEEEESHSESEQYLSASGSQPARSVSPAEGYNDETIKDNRQRHKLTIDVTNASGHSSQPLQYNGNASYPAQKSPSIASASSPRHLTTPLRSPGLPSSPRHIEGYTATPRRS